MYRNIGATPLSKPVQICSERDKEEWNLFVDKTGGSFFHYFDWKYIYENHNQARYIPLVIRNSATEIQGIFPLLEQRGPLYPSLYSLPIGASDGFLISGTLDDEGKKAVLLSFLEFIDAQYSSSHSLLGLREHLPRSVQPIHPSAELIQNGFTWFDAEQSQLPCTHVLKLEQPFHEKIWSGLWSKKLRKRIRHVRKSNIQLIIDDDFKYKSDFIEMQIQTAEKFGLVEKKEVHEQIFSIFKNKLKLFILVKDSKPLAGALCYYTPEMAYLAMAPYRPPAMDFLTNTLPICASIRYACDSGYRFYDMGISQTSTLAAHKEKFGAKRIPLMMYQKKFSYFKMFSNKTISGITGFFRKFV